MKLITNITFSALFAFLISAVSGAPLLLSGAIVASAALYTLPSGVLSAKIGTLAASTATTLQIQYLPEFITFVSPLPPSSIKVEVLGDGTTLNLDTLGAQIMNNINSLGSQEFRYTYQLANGLLTNKTVEITIDNPNATEVEVYGFSPDGIGNAYAVYQKNTILADSGKDLSDFAAIGIGAPDANDIYIMEYIDGTQDKLSIEEIDAYQPLFQNYDPSAAGLLINNTSQQYTKVNVTPSSNRSVYVLNFQADSQIENEIN